MQIPIACTLTRQAAGSQLEEWRDLLIESAATTERASPTDLFFRLKDDRARLDALVRLAQREKACCGFFEFAILIDANEVALRVSVPIDAAAILDDFARLGMGLAPRPGDVGSTRSQRS